MIQQDLASHGCPAAEQQPPGHYVAHASQSILSTRLGAVSLVGGLEHMLFNGLLGGRRGKSAW